MFSPLLKRLHVSRLDFDAGQSLGKSIPFQGQGTPRSCRDDLVNDPNIDRLGLLSFDYDTARVSMIPVRFVPE
jgi:hypothetical protein